MVVVVVDVVGVDCYDFVFLGFFFGGVGDDQVIGGGLFGFDLFDDDVVFEWFDGN